MTAVGLRPTENFYMDVLGLQSLIATYDKTGNTEICALSKNISTSSLGTSGTGATEITRYVTSGSIRILCLLHSVIDGTGANNVAININSTNMSAMIVQNNVNAYINGSTNGNGVQGLFYVSINDATIILKGMQAGTGSHISISFAFIFLVYH